MQAALRAAIAALLALLLRPAWGQGGTAAVAPFTTAIESSCVTATLSFLVRYYFPISPTGASSYTPAPFSCVHMGNESVPAAWLPPEARGGGDPRANATAGYCIAWPGAVGPGGAASGPNTTVPVWFVSAAMGDGRALVYGDSTGGDKLFLDLLTGQPCQPPAADCLKWTQVSAAEYSWLDGVRHCVALVAHLPCTPPCSLKARSRRSWTALTVPSR